MQWKMFFCLVKLTVTIKRGTTMLSLFKTLDTLEYAPEPVIDDTLDDNLIVLDANGDRSEDAMDVLNSVLAVRAPGYTVESTDKGWTLNRLGTHVPFYDGMWV